MMHYADKLEAYRLFINYMMFFMKKGDFFFYIRKLTRIELEVLIQGWNARRIFLLQVIFIFLL